MSVCDMQVDLSQVSRNHSLMFYQVTNSWDYVCYKSESLFVNCFFSSDCMWSKIGFLFRGLDKNS